VPRAAAARQTGKKAGPRKRARPRNRGESRARLLEAAVTVFAERGYQAASVDEVAARAGLSKGAVYWNFDSKEELFQALYEERIQGRLQDMLELTEAAPADRPTSGEVDRIFVELLEQEPELLLLSFEFWARAMRDPQLRRRYAQRTAGFRDALARVLEARQKQLGAPEFSLPAEHAATAFIALANGLAMIRLADAKGVPDGLYGEILSLVYDGLVARAQRGG
jgi:AcrR family transcriptional regulator